MCTDATAVRHGRSTHFHEQEHRNFLAVDEQLGAVAVSVKKEVQPGVPGAFQYRCIVRSAKVCVVYVSWH